MKRRDILKYTAYATGAALSAPLITSILSGCKSDIDTGTSGYIPQFFSKSQFKNLGRIIDVILPKTDSPSATEVGVDQMMDHMAHAVFTPEEQENWKKQLTALANFVKGKIGGKSLKDQSGEELTELFTSLMSSESESEAEAKSAFTRLKQQSIAYYLSTEEVGKNFLNYLPVPGEYQACIDLSEVGGKAWAL